MIASTFEYDGHGFTYDFDRHSVSKHGKLYVTEPNVHFNNLNHGDITNTYSFTEQEIESLSVIGSDGRRYMVIASQAAGLTPSRFGNLLFRKTFKGNFRLYKNDALIKPRGWSLIQAYIMTGLCWVPLTYYLYKIYSKVDEECLKEQSKDSKN